MGARLLSIRRKSPTSSPQRAPGAAAATATTDDAPTPIVAAPTSNSSTNFYFPKRLANMMINPYYRPSTPLATPSTIEGIDSTSTTKPKRSMRLSISPDEDESDSMQVVMLVEGSPINTTIKTMKTSISKYVNAVADQGVGGVNEEDQEEEEDNCIYTVGSVEYSVYHASTSSSSSGSTATASCATSDSTTIVTTITAAALLPELDTQATNSSSAEVDNAVVEASSSGEGGSNKKSSVSRMGSFFKKSSITSGGGGGGNTEGNGYNDSSGGGGGSSDTNNHSGDGHNNRPNKSNSNSTSPRDATFTPERIQFAIESTLPIHSGPESLAPTHHPSWTPVPGTEFKVRHGPNYLKTGKKENSCESLYEVYCVRYFRSAKGTVGGASRIMPLPELVRSGESNNIAAGDGCDGVTVEENGGMGTKAEGGGNPPTPPHHPELFGTKVPDVLVVHFMLPYETPNMFKTKEDGAGGECIYYLKPSQRFLDEISGRRPATPATKLFVRWCSECEFNSKMRGRFKCMALVRDIDRHNLSLLKSYQGKPVLITESGRVFSGVQGGVRYLEMIANVHYWAYMAKKGFVSLIPKFANMQMEVGFTIEAHTDSEMPECMLGSTVLSYITDTTGPMISPEMQEPVHEHQA